MPRSSLFSINDDYYNNNAFAIDITLIISIFITTNNRYFHVFSGTFTISNLGMFGVAQFDAILPPGTGSILAIAASTPKVVQLKSGHFGVQKSMTVTITCDHRHIYGADAAEFLKDLAGVDLELIDCLVDC